MIDKFLNSIKVFTGPLIKVGLPLIKNVLISLAKSALILLPLTGAASAVDAGIRKEIP